jgi:membrane glycosyltransferase
VLAALTIYEMVMVLKVDGLTIVEWLVLVLFAISTLWISLPFMTALAGLVRLAVRRPKRSGEQPLSTRTAILQPVYNEEPTRVAAALDAMAQSLLAMREGHSFDLFILSDTTDAAIALAEQELVWALRRRVGNGLRVYYRRRLRNTAHKAGNIRDFCQRWGHAYDHLLILDADSLLTGATMVELVRRMERDPDLGLLQTVPRLHNSNTLVGRLQQFAGMVYGPVLSAGLAWWTGREGNFWGHNAVVRTRAFMESAGLPDLPGRPPFGGPILSHDFVEAALIRRAGWNVVIADDLEGSYEECPPSIIEMAARDRRWCQGNLQHTRVLLAKGLSWVSRFHMLSGILAYLSSPIWFLFLLSALALGVQNEFAKPEYFNASYTLFPLWPHIDPERALRLFKITLVILMGPKLMGLLAFVVSRRRVRASGGYQLLLFNVLVEILLSALIAPIMMLIHCGLVMDVLRGRDSGWRAQNRVDGSVPWSMVLRRHGVHMFVGVALAMAGLSISWEMLAWLVPAVMGMVLAAPLSGFTASASVGQGFVRAGILRVPEDSEPAPVEQEMLAAEDHYRNALAHIPDLLTIASDTQLLHRHLALLDHQSLSSDPVDPVMATVDVKIRNAESLEDAVARLNAAERTCVESVPELLLRLSGLPRRIEER